MHTQLTIIIQPFGAIKKYFTQPIMLNLPIHATMNDLRHTLIHTITAHNPDFSQTTLIYESAFANEQHILAENFSFTENTRLAILPPVCGG